MRGKRLTTAIVLAGAVLMTNPLGQLGMQAGDVAVADEKDAPRAAVSGLASRFGKQYEPITVDAKPKIPAYTLPLKAAQIGNLEYARGRLRNIGAVQAQLLKDGVAGCLWRGDDFVSAYRSIRRHEVPVYVTSDSMLHLYHIQFDETLKSIEQTEFVPKLTAMCDRLVVHLLARHKAAKTDAERAGMARALAFTAMGLELLTDTRDEEKALTAYRRKLSGGDFYSPLIMVEELKATNLPLNASITGAPGWAKVLRTRGAAPQKRAFLNLLDDMIARAKKARRKVALPTELRGWVDADRKHADAHKGFRKSAIFHYKEDFSQYVPRGHYTRGYDLQRYFMAMMWFGRLTFLAKGGEPHGPSAPYLVSAAEARHQTMAAAALTKAFKTLTLDGQTAWAIWDRIYAITAFFVGLADDLTPAEYHHALSSALGDDYRPAALGDPKLHTKVKAELVKLRKPAIYSGTGDIETDDTSPGSLDRQLGKTQGWRFMGQRFVPDSYMLGKLVYPTVKTFTGPAGANPFTMSKGKLRGMPRGLDVMAVLGSARARKHLDDGHDSAYGNYAETLDKLKKQFDKLDTAGWNLNLYWSWLYCLKGLLRTYPAGYQPYMRRAAWQDKQLNAALGSWSQLRHDTILYAKQSYTMKPTSAPMQPKDYPGYVEPVPEFYARLQALNRLTLKVLGQMDVLNDPSRQRLLATDKLLGRLIEISKKELANQPLTKADAAWIKGFDSALKTAVVGHGQNAMKTTLIADVHTDGITSTVLEEGTGQIGLVVVANRLPDGSIGLAVGPVFTYYEFRHPMNDRLTDEKWRTMLRSGGQLKDKLPAFTRSYFVR